MINDLGSPLITVLFRQFVIVNYVGFYGETTMTVQLFGDYPGAMEFVEDLQFLLGMTRWLMMIDGAGLNKQEATIEGYNG